MSTQNADLTQDELGKIIEGIEAGHTIATVTNYKQENLEKLYALAYNYYTTDNYEQAEKIFNLLCLYDYWDPRYSMGLAGCYQATGCYEKAIEVYQMAALAGGMNDPTPIYYASLCFVNLGKAEEAIVGLENAILFGNESEYTDIRKAAKDLLEMLKNSEEKTK